MKLLPLLLSICCACTLLDAELPLGSPRAFEHHTSRRPAHTADSTAASAPDTSFYVSAVTFPASYDWQRDSAYGAVACTLKLYKGTVQLLSLPAGPSQRISASHDRHHIIGGALISVYSDYKGTTIKRNGVQLADWPQRETVTGILLKNNDIHTIGLDPSGKSFTYRINGEAKLKIDNAAVFGGFGKSSYGPTGSVYEDKGQVCFAYKTYSGSAYLVRDGKAELLMTSPGTEFLDVKQSKGATAMLYNDDSGLTQMNFGGEYYNVNSSGSLHWDSGEVLDCDGTPALLGAYRWERTTLNGQGLWSMNMMWCFNFIYFYCYGGPWDNIYFSQPRPGWEDCYFFNRSCATPLGKDLAAVLTPHSPARKPFLAFRQDTLRYNIHGFLSGVSVQIDD